MYDNEVYDDDEEEYEEDNFWLKAVLVGCGLGLVLGILVIGALLLLFFTMGSSSPSSQVEIQPTAVGEVVSSSDDSMASGNDGADDVALESNVQLPTAIAATSVPQTQTQAPVATAVEEPTAPSAAVIAPATLMPTLAPTQPLTPTNFVVPVVPTQTPTPLPTIVPAQLQSTLAVYTEAQIQATLEEIAVDNSLPLQNISVMLENERVTISAEQFGIPSQFVTLIYAKDGELVVEVESAVASGQPLPRELFPLLEDQIFSGLNAELADEYSYTYLEEIAIKNGGLLIQYR